MFLRIEADKASTPIRVSVLAFLLERLCEGYPVLEEWLTLGRDIFHGGWESHREAIEVRPTEKVADGKPLEFASLLANRGFQRLSILMFGVLWTYKKMASTMTPAQDAEFRRHETGRVHERVLNQRLVLSSSKFPLLAGWWFR